MAQTKIYRGGSFAPPLTESVISDYRGLVKKAEPQVAEAMQKLLDCVDVWWELPESTEKSSKHESGRADVTPLDEKTKKTLWDHIPWTDELRMYAGLFDRIDPSQKELRDAAHHLLWFAFELDLDREPLTLDKVAPIV